MFPPGPQKPKEVPPWNTKKLTDAPASKMPRKVLATSLGSRKLLPVSAPQASNQPGSLAPEALETSLLALGSRQALAPWPPGPGTPWLSRTVLNPQRLKAHLKPQAQRFNAPAGPIQNLGCLRSGGAVFEASPLSFMSSESAATGLCKDSVSRAFGRFTVVGSGIGIE